MGFLAQKEERITVLSWRLQVRVPAQTNQGFAALGLRTSVCLQWLYIVSQVDQCNTPAQWWFSVFSSEQLALWHKNRQTEWLSVAEP